MREWMEYQALNRFQELDDDEDEMLDLQLGQRRFIGDKPRFSGYESGSGRQRMYPRGAVFGDAFAFEEGEEDGLDLYDDQTNWQWEMREREQALVDGALRRINRARLRGDSSPTLSREEIDALERRQLIPITSKVRAQASTASTKPTSAKPKRKSAGGTSLFGFGGNASSSRNKATRSTDRRTSLPEASSRRSSGQNTPDEMAGQLSSAYFQQPSSGRPSSSPSKGSRSGSRVTSGPVARQAAMPEMREYRPPSRSSPNSVPLDAYAPRARAGSSAQIYTSTHPYQYGPPQGQPYYPSPGRRNVSGPAAMPYPSSRRAMHQSHAVARMPSGSGLSQEVIEISSDDSEEEGEEDDDDEAVDESEDDESDEGVTLNAPLEGNASGYSVHAGRGTRVRRGRR